MKIFNWKLFYTWELFFSKFLLNRIKNIYNLINEYKSTINYVDSAGPIIDYLKQHERIESYNEEFCLSFRGYFKFLTAYHACNTADLQSYYKNGLKCLSIKEMNDRFINEFGSGKFPELSIDHLKDITEKIDTQGREGKLYVALDDREIIEYCGHYLIRGSEYLFSLIQNLKYPIDKYKTYLQSKSKPTIFRLHLPLNLVKDHELWELFDDLLNQWIYRKAHNSPGNKTLNFSLELYEDLNSKYIISHFHPKYIRDPHNGRRILNTTNGKYIQDKLSK